MTKTLDTVLLLALPASGKSEVRKYLALLDEKKCREEFHMGPTVQLDDFPYVHMMRQADVALQELGQTSVFFQAADKPFKEPRDWGTLIELINEDYADLFSSDMKVKGLIPFYPPNGLQSDLMTGAPELLNPEMLVEEDSPPCLVFHGTSDGWVPPRVTKSLKNTYTSKNNKECAILWMPLGGHACDSYFSGYYNQVFLYYMERFLYLYH